MRNKLLIGSMILWLSTHLVGCGGLFVEQSNPVTDDPKPVVVSLVTNAQQRERAGQLNQAAASLERALRIEPRDPLIWHRLAKIRLQQLRSKQAIHFATRSNSFVGKDHPLRSKNWILIADAYEELGDYYSAVTAREKAREKPVQ